MENSLEMTQERDQLFAALTKALPQIPTVPKNGKAQYGNHRLLDDILDAVKPIFEEHGLFLTLPPTDDGLTILIGHSSGQFMKAWMKFPDKDTNSRQTNQHSRGGDITYFRRYMLESVLGIAGDEDTDGEHSHQPHQNHAPKKEFTASPDKPSSEKQHNYIKSLCKQKDSPKVRELLSDYGITGPQDFGALSQLDAKNLIDALQNL